jgi:hypothetical protein
MRSHGPSGTARIVRLLGCLTALAVATVELGAQVCIGGTSDSRGWLAFSVGRADGSATTVGADVAGQISRRVALVGESSVTAYPTPDPRRERLALGIAYRFAAFDHFGLCLTPGVAVEQIGDLSVLRLPVGVSLGWSTTSQNGHKGFGVRVEPFFVYSRETIAMFSHTSRVMSGRAAIVGSYRGWLLGLEHEEAFDRDARRHTRVRFGFTFE